MTVPHPGPAVAGASWAVPVPHRLPTAAWALAWASVASQLVNVVDQGLRLQVLTPLSMLLGALLVWWFAHGVLTGRMVRLVVVWLLLVVTFVGEASTLLDSGPGDPLLLPTASMLTSVAMMVALGWFMTTPYYAWQRTRPIDRGPSLAGPLLVAVLVGASGGMVAVDTPPGLHIEIGG